MYISIGGIFMGLFDNLLGNASKANLDRKMMILPIPTFTM